MEVLATTLHVSRRYVSIPFSHAGAPSSLRGAHSVHKLLSVVQGVKRLGEGVSV